MKTVLLNLAALVIGIIVGSMVNMGIITFGPSLIPLPEGVNPADMESLKANMHLFEARHFIAPFLAHALGTLVGALIAFTIAASHKAKFALGIGVFFLFGGIANVIMLPSPLWFAVLDITMAYIPMAYMAVKMRS